MSSYGVRPSDQVESDEESGEEFDFDDDDDEYYNSYDVELTISCRKLITGKLLTKSSPMVVMYRRGKGEWIECGRTEKIENATNPDFASKLIMEYYFQEIQRVMFEVYSNTAPTEKLQKSNLIGRLSTTLGDIIKSPQRFRAQLRSENKSSGGELIIIPEQLNSCKETITMEWNARNLDKKDTFGKSDPFMVFYKSNADGSLSKCYETEVVKNNVNPDFKRMSISASALCNGDYNRVIEVQVFDWNRTGKMSPIGKFATNLQVLSQGRCAANTYECINPKLAKKNKKYKNSGVVSLLSCKIEKQLTFIDYIRSGTELSFVVALDMSSSNGDQRFTSSLHYNSSTQPSQYEQAIRAVGDVIQHYDTDGLFPAFGFGAQLPPEGYVSDKFALNFNDAEPSCQGIEGVIEAYHRCIQEVGLCEPTNFAPIIKHVSSLAAGVIDSSNYYVLLIITDGGITDLQQTKEAIFHAARIPMSIIIIGVGNGDFKEMNELDGDSLPLTYRGKRVERDIVQFVAMKEFFEPGQEQTADLTRLAKEVLAEIPDQLVQYMTSKGLQPM